MPATSKVWPLIAANLLIPLALVTFAIGFFPYKPFLPGLAQYNTDLYATQPDAPFDKVIFMVVDALRSDFVYSDNTGFKFLQSLIRDGSAIPFTAHATSPTITMPRIKAITTGSTPSFLDLILNFAESDTSSSLAAQDTWLAQMKAKDSGKLVMYGDDTWLKLFPDTFDRAEGTTSFFVADFTEVDNNVTRHVPGELKHEDWNTMVLHYLGLDHIGHKTGPRSPFMVPKQSEMDNIVEMMYKAIESEQHLQSTLLVLAGDHGMNDGGNHGASSPGETSPALVFASPKFKTTFSGQKSPVSPIDDFQYHSRVQQSDIAPTLAGLLGFPVPKNNLGVLITDFLSLWSSGDGLQLLHQNARQILSIVEAASPKGLFDEASTSLDCKSPSSQLERLACDWRNIQQLEADHAGAPVHAKQLTKALSTWSKDAQEFMSGAASDYDIPKLVTGAILAACGLLLSINAAWPTLSANPLASLPFLTVCSLYAVLMFASSYVEEEHHFWYWATSGWFLFIFAKEVNRYKRGASISALAPLLALAALRVCRRWNQTGQKYAGSPDIARSFLAEHNILLWIFIAATYASTSFSLARTGFPSLARPQAAALAFALFVLAMNFKIAFTLADAPELLRGIKPLNLSMLSRYSGNLDLVSNARILFASLGTCLAYTLLASLITPSPTPAYHKATLTTTLSLLTLLLYTQSRTTSIPLYPLFTFLPTTHRTLLSLTTSLLLLSQAAHSSLGLNAAISSIDLSLAYNAQTTYSPVLVGLLTFISNFSGPIYIMLLHIPLFKQYTNRQLTALSRVSTLKTSTSTSSSSPTSTTPTALTRQNSTKTLTKKAAKITRAIKIQIYALLTVFTTTSMLGCMAACMALRTHLFVWTVFSPKFLWIVAWGVGVQGLVWGVGVAMI